MSNKKLRIWVGKKTNDIEDSIEWTTCNYNEAEEPKFNLSHVLESFAEYYHDDLSGHEDRWPITFHAEDMDRKYLGYSVIDRDYSVTFSADKTELA